MSEIPVIDLTPFQDGGSAEDRRVVAEEVAVACETLGFLVVSGHGVPKVVSDALYGEAHKFFDRPLDEKLTVRRPRNDQNRGYIPYGEETLAKMHGGVTPPDYKEVFAIGPDDLPDEPYYTGPLSYPDFAPNLWPDGSPGLRPAMLAYYVGMERLSRMLGHAYALALDLPEDFYVERLTRHASQLRLLHYPAPTSDLAPDQLRCGVHTDLGLTTILRNEAAPGGLEVRTRNGTWIPAPAIPDTFVVNLGDLMMRWTNDRWRSTPHRVAVPAAEARSRSRRLSIGFFVAPNYD
ncbi:MAG: isopenicillin N synthase family oxygenase, partial [Rhodospirillaceae bacterium]|nr:isopenicillin N synthase family oxygenase [Rhodospirillaceae bacterium]